MSLTIQHALTSRLPGQGVGSLNPTLDASSKEPEEPAEGSLESVSVRGVPVTWTSQLSASQAKFLLRILYLLHQENGFGATCSGGVGGVPLSTASVF